MSNSNQRIGIAGDLASGKDQIGNLLQDVYGYVHISCSDFLRSYIASNNLGLPDRETCTRVASDLRTTKGATFLVDQCLEEYSGEERLALSGIYSPSEALRIKSIGGHMLYVACHNEQMRYDRIVTRGQTRDNLTFEEFQAAKRRENAGDSTQQNVAAIAQLADYHILNEGSLADLADEVGLVHELIMSRQPSGYAPHGA